MVEPTQKNTENLKKPSEFHFLRFLIILKMFKILEKAENLSEGCSGQQRYMDSDWLMLKSLMKFWTLPLAPAWSLEISCGGRSPGA